MLFVEAVRILKLPIIRCCIAISLTASCCLYCNSVVAEEVVAFGSGGNQFAMIFVPIGNPGNQPDNRILVNPPGAGSVSYNFSIGKFEVSREMVTKANSAGALGITPADLAHLGGNGANRPAGLTWNQAARFINWLNTSQGFLPAYKFAVHPGNAGYNSNANIVLWQVGDPGFDSANPFRNRFARFFLPNVDEWYKAAYYDPSLNDGAGGYWRFPTSTDIHPIAVSGGTLPGTAVYNRPFSQGPADVENAGGLNSYSVMGMFGNVWEWEETSDDLINSSGASRRGYRGGDWADFSAGMSTSERYSFPTDYGPTVNLGFRVAGILDNFPITQVVDTKVVYANWVGNGSPVDNQRELLREGLGYRTLTPSNLINSGVGINGLVFDIQNLWYPNEISLEDFRFQMSPQGAFSELINPPSGWQTAPDPVEISITVHPDQTDISRISIRWADFQIMNRWLRVTIESNQNTGLIFNEVYYLGHLLGETTGPEGSFYTVSFSDITLIRQAVGTQVEASSIFDIDKNGTVSFADISAMRSQVGTVLTNITIP